VLFNSIPFLFFLPIVYSLYWLIKQQYRWIVLLIASYYFYMGWSVGYALLLLATTIIDYWSALKMSEASSPASRKRYLLFSLLSNLSVLAGFKYFVFFYNSGVDVSNYFLDTHWSTLERIIIPVGLSFYTFQSLSYTIDVYRGDVVPEKSLGRFALYVSFFPQLVAGPIERFNDLMPQLFVPKQNKLVIIIPAVRLMVWGFFKKMVIADRLAEIVDPVFANVHGYSGSTLLLTGFLFVVQVYCDFSGYTDIATGTAKLFGIDLCINWRRPLLSKSLTEFWKRNHISITSWFRNYLYIPLGGNRKSYHRWLLNIFLVFLISGLWHGADWTFVLWGTMHGVMYLIELLVSKRYPSLKLPAFAGHFYLLLFHTITLIAFRAQSASDLFVIYHKIVADFNASALNAELLSIKDSFPLAINAMLIVLFFAKEIQEEITFIKPSLLYYNYLRPVFYVLLFLSIFLIGNFNNNQFIYFRF
jgi:alginate O-acetyltransferase complex protein AlgI